MKEISLDSDDILNQIVGGISSTNVLVGSSNVTVHQDDLSLDMSLVNGVISPSTPRDDKPIVKKPKLTK